MKLKKVLKIVLALLIAALLIVGAYVLYVVLQYDRIEDGVSLEINGEALKDEIEVGMTYTAMTYNIGFGAYLPDYSFFMDTGTMADGTAVQGKSGKAESKESVIYSTEGSIGVIEELDTDFVLLQEVDVDSSRARHVNQAEMITSAFDMEYTYSSDFHSAFLFYPFTDPHGKTESGLLTLSDIEIEDAVRRSYPVDNGFPTRFFDLDRCFAVHRIEVSNGKELVLVNSHMSAYDEGGLIRRAQLEFLNGFLEEEYGKGNYIIVGGDYNHVLTNALDKAFTSQQLYPEWISILDEEDLPSFMNIVTAENAYEVPTCRTADIPYTKGVNYTAVIDGFIVSDNVKAEAENIDVDFAYSDHNPVKLTFSLLP